MSELTREERTARLTFLRDRERANKARVRGGRLMDQPLDRRIVHALFDPGAITDRGDNYAEPLYAWQARAVMAVLAPELSDLADFEKSVPA
jgi:hypothetical protein